MDTQTDLSEAISEAAASPRKVASDVGSVEQRSVSELIEAEKFLRSKQAANNQLGAWGAVGFAKISPDGSL